jgi:hypothetical protein
MLLVPEAPGIVFYGEFMTGVFIGLFLTIMFFVTVSLPIIFHTISVMFIGSPALT